MVRPVLFWSFTSGIVDLQQNDWAWLPSTGFLDRDKTEVFRGDLVSFGGRTAEVVWNQEQGWHELVFHDRDGRFQRLHLNAALASCICVVGNSHEGKNYSPVGSSR